MLCTLGTTFDATGDTLSICFCAAGFQPGYCGTFSQLKLGTSNIDCAQGDGVC